MAMFSDESSVRDGSTSGTAVAALVTLAVFFAVYFYVANEVMRQVLIYFLVLVGLYFSASWTHAAAVTSIAGVLLIVFNCVHRWPITTTGLTVVLVVSAAVPYYYERLSKLSATGFMKTASDLKQKIAELDNEQVTAEKAKSALENEIEKINQLYILGRELVEHMELEDVLEHLQRILLNRPGVSDVAVFSWEKNRWKILSCSDPELREKLLGYIDEQRQLWVEKGIKQLQPPEYLAKKSVIFWPIRLEKDLMAGVLIIAEIESAGRFMEEGNIFIPQIALGLKRTRLFAEVRDRSRVDGLTGLYLRRYFIERLQTEIQRAKRYSGIFSLLMLDLDFFKKVNDTHGHIVGDKVLCGVSRIFVDCVRPGDLVGRYGGEEFIILIPMSPVEEVLNIAREINKLVPEKEFSSEKEKFNVTVSIGISHYPLDGASVEEMIYSADQALYWVKTNGRNGIKEYSEISPRKTNHDHKKTK